MIKVKGKRGESEGSRGGEEGQRVAQTTEGQR